MQSLTEYFFNKSEIIDVIKRTKMYEIISRQNNEAIVNVIALERQNYDTAMTDHLKTIITSWNIKLGLCLSD